ncbi:hypothetical protein Ctha_1395 [Chloroherpeton thalassium ATCC 35110]|uniref:Uncharacterized protein n=1 Tax=Chloroherpeton thalassium (strain ATCC 35110 / GB-78) TaxID=517418 RepID=B3QRQ5_CHLT3|nr:hypothetical protein [Chloroherpeton thalassium]ACF13858.1 hypothetical protein Ctha_1395 [Chloroherpeton thalassium ATCC 35110]
MLPETEQYLYELPDYIQGNTTPEVAASIEKLLRTDALFLAEYEQLKQTMGELDRLTSTCEADMRAEIPNGYFGSFADRLQTKLHARARRRNFREEIFEMLSGFFSPAPIAEFGAAIAGFAVVVVMFAFAFTWQSESSITAEMASAIQTLSSEEDNYLSTLNFSDKYASMSQMLSLTDEEASQVLETINEVLPENASDATDSYEVLSPEEASEILNLL